MALVAVKFPDEKWRKVNVSRFLKKFEEVPVSKLVKVPEEELDRVLDVLRRNGCIVRLLEPADVETEILNKIIKTANAIKFGSEKPEELGKLAIDAIARIGLENMSDELADLLHDCVDFSENPTITELNEIEKRARELLC